MNNEKTARDIARYAGCECTTDGDIFTIVGLSSYYRNPLESKELIYEVVVYDIDGEYQEFPNNYVHPLLRTIEQRNEEELAEINKIWKSMKGKGKIAKLDMLVHIPFRTMYSKVVDYLRSIGIDCDGLIDSGVAIRKG